MTEPSDGEIELLKLHYESNILAHCGPAQGFDELISRLTDEQSDIFAETVVKGLNGAFHGSGEWKKSNITGSRMLEYDRDSSLIVLQVPLLFFSNTDGITYNTEEFRLGSTFCGMNVVLVAVKDSVKHEKKHVTYNRFSLPRKDIADLFYGCERSKEDFVENRDFEKAEEYAKLLSLERETRLISELMAYGFGIAYDRGRRYSEDYARFMADELYDTGLLPDGNIVSRHAAKNMAESAARDYFSECFDSGREAFDYLYMDVLFGKLSRQELERIVMSCGPSREDIVSGAYKRPFEELAMWHKHREELGALLESYRSHCKTQTS